MTHENETPECYEKLPIRDWDLVRFLLCVARAGSISRASEHLSESPATVGRKLREIEKDLAVPVFDRGTAGVTLTSIGQEILKSAERIEAELTHIGEICRAHRGLSGGRVCVSTPEGLGEAIVAPRLIEFHSLNPEIQIDLLLSNKRINLHNREADIAVRLGRSESHRISSEKLGEVAFGIYASRDYLFGLDEINSAAELAGHNVIVATGALSRTVQEEEFRKIIGKCNIAARTDNINAQLSAVKSGFGFAVLPKYMTRPHSDLVEVMPGFLKSTVELWILTHQDVADYPHVQTTKQFLVEMCESLVNETLPTRVKEHCQRNGRVR